MTQRGWWDTDTILPEYGIRKGGDAAAERCRRLPHGARASKDSGGCPRPPTRSGFTSTPVPRYSEKSNWEQYREVFEAIVTSNGWDSVTAALQLLSHLDGDTLNVAFLVPECRDF